MRLPDAPPLVYLYRPGADMPIEVEFPGHARRTGLAYVERLTTFSPLRDLAGCRIVGTNGACADTFIARGVWTNMPAEFKREPWWMRGVL